MRLIKSDISDRFKNTITGYTIGKVINSNSGNYWYINSNYNIVRRNTYTYSVIDKYHL